MRSMQLQLLQHSRNPQNWHLKSRQKSSWLKASPKWLDKPAAELPSSKTRASNMHIHTAQQAAAKPFKTRK
jgi:hypothetical protein